MHEQLILFGAPGTGKSYEVRQRLHGISSEKIFRVTIHPEYQYSDFVGQLLPQTTGTGNSSSTFFSFVPGPFTDALVEAYSDTSKNVYLVLEELSRGNVSAIFGDIFQLLDRDQHFESKYPIRNKDIAEQIPTLIGDEIKLPSNLNIMCTVNMNDQNVFPMDTAFKRRFDWEYVPTTPVKDEKGDVRKDLNNPKIIIMYNSNGSQSFNTNWQSFYTALNNFITNKNEGLGKNEDKQVGQFFLEFNDKLVSDSHDSDAKVSKRANDKINQKIKNKLLLYLWQDIENTSSFSDRVRMFSKDVNSFEDLYLRFDKTQVFSENFIEKFLLQDKDKYPYS